LLKVFLEFVIETRIKKLLLRGKQTKPKFEADSFPSAKIFALFGFSNSAQHRSQIF
jgi:hypothetical protein